MRALWVKFVYFDISHQVNHVSYIRTSALHKKSLTLNQKCFSFLAKCQENGPLAEKRQDRKGKRTRQKNKRGDRKGNQMPALRKPHISGLPSGPVGGVQQHPNTSSSSSNSSSSNSSSSSSNWIWMSCQPHRVASGQSNSGHKQIHISKLFSHIYQPSAKSIYKTNHFTNITHIHKIQT